MIGELLKVNKTLTSLDLSTVRIIFLELISAEFYCLGRHLWFIRRSQGKYNSQAAYTFKWYYSCEKKVDTFSGYAGLAQGRSWSFISQKER